MICSCRYVRTHVRIHVCMYACTNVYVLYACICACKVSARAQPSSPLFVSQMAMLNSQPGVSLPLHVGDRVRRAASLRLALRRRSRDKGRSMTVSLGLGCPGILYKLPQDGRSSAFFLLLPASQTEAWLPSTSSAIGDVL